MDPPQENSSRKILNLSVRGFRLVAVGPVYSTDELWAQAASLSRLSWDALAPWTEYQRRVRGERYLIDFEKLAKRSHHYWRVPARPNAG